MIKGIIFDWGGVLINDPWPGIMSFCAKQLKVETRKLEPVVREFHNDFQKGLVSEDVFWGRVCSKLGVQSSGKKSLWGDAFSHAYDENREVFSLAAELKKSGYRVGFLSNTEIPSMNYFHERGYRMFDTTVFSCAEGVQKPERKIYRIALERLGIWAEEAVFIDDKKTNVEGAEQVGINAILFTTAAEAKKQLKSLGVVF